MSVLDTLTNKCLFIVYVLYYSLITILVSMDTAHINNFHINIPHCLYIPFSIPISLIPFCHIPSFSPCPNDTWSCNMSQIFKTSPHTPQESLTSSYLSPSGALTLHSWLPVAPWPLPWIKRSDPMSPDHLSYGSTVYVRLPNQVNMHRKAPYVKHTLTNWAAFVPSSNN